MATEKKTLLTSVEKYIKIIETAKELKKVSPTLEAKPKV